MTAADAAAPIGVIGGSGLYEFVARGREVEVTTPFGAPSDPITVGDVGGRPVAFLPRHGRDHRFPPHLVNYRANLWALRALGVRQVLAASAVGSLRPELGPGSVVLPDQVVDRTQGREGTVYDAAGTAVHVSMADPYCPRGRRAVLDAGRREDLPVTDGGTLVVVQGPRFSTRAESRWHVAAGWTLVGMTGMPETGIARELAMCLTGVGLVTDLDAGVDAGEGVTQAEVMEVFARNVVRLRSLLESALALLPDDDNCPCQHALDGLRLPFELP